MTVGEWVREQIHPDVEKACNDALAIPREQFLCRDHVPVGDWTPADDRWRANQDAAVHLWFYRYHTNTPGEMKLHTRSIAHPVTGETVRIAYVSYDPNSKKGN
jgi:hypothetical protein